MVNTATMILRERLRRTVLELIPDEFSEAGILRQHLGRDQHHPADPERQAAGR